MTTPIYNPKVPENPNDSLAITQPDLLANFDSLFNIFGINHMALNASSEAGDHIQAQLLEQFNSQQTQVSEISVYTKDVEGQTDQTFIRFQGNGQEFQFTNWQLYQTVQENTQINYFTFLPGKILVYFGSFTTLTNNTLNLYPPIAKNIITANFCPNTSTPSGISKPPSYKSMINIPKAQNGYFTAITVNLASLSFSSPQAPAQSFYFVMVNV